jgi:hypothetical protein
MKVYGPYTRKDGRQHVIIVSDGVRKTISYPKYLLEQKLKRSLFSYETCDHIDGDYTNNSLDNLQVLTRSDNTKKHAVVYNKAEEVCCICPECSVSFYAKLTLVRHNNIKQKKAGPFCSKRCAGKYGQRLNKTFRNGTPNPRYIPPTPE